MKGSVVKNFVPKDWGDDFSSDDNFSLCSNPDCKITYFSYEKNLFFTNEDMKVPIWFKKGASPKIICYCHRITEDMIVEQVKLNGLVSFKDIVLKYRNRVVCNCDKLNPIGECCTKVFYSIINRTLKELGKEEVPVPDSCC